MSIPKKLAASAAVLAAVASFVSFGVFSAFSDTKTNTSDLTSATFGLTQSPAGSLLDNITNLIPGDTITRCVKLTNSGGVPVTVTAKPAITDVAPGTLRAVLGMTVQKVTGFAPAASSADIKSCTGTLTGGDYVIGSAGSPVLGASLADTALAGGSGANWAAGETNYYRVVVTLPSSVVDLAYAGDEVDAQLNFVANQLTGTTR